MNVKMEMAIKMKMDIETVIEIEMEMVIEMCVSFFVSTVSSVFHKILLLLAYGYPTIGGCYRGRIGYRYLFRWWHRIKKDRKLLTNVSCGA